MKKNNITITHPLIAREWDYKKNKPLLPTDVTKGQTDNVYWICPMGHSYDARIDHRCSMKSGCRYCAHKAPYLGETDLKTVYPEIAEEWDYDHNPDRPEDYLPISNKKKKWICPICHQSYERRIDERTLGKMGCRHCTNPGERSTSQQEQAFVFYFSMVTTVQNREKVSGYEVDIYLPKMHTGNALDFIAPLICFMTMMLYVLAAMIRLAYFNVQEEIRQKEEGGVRKYYQGLPVTSAALIFPFVEL